MKNLMKDYLSTTEMKKIDWIVLVVGLGIIGTAVFLLNNLHLVRNRWWITGGFFIFALSFYLFTHFADRDKFQ
jgi:hypothetical protein